MRCLIIIIVLFSSCLTEKKLANRCANKFPVRESTSFVQGEVRFDTTYIAGDTLVFQDTIRVNCDSVKGVITRYVYKEKACPPERIVNRHQVDTFKVTKVDSALVEYHRLDARDQKTRADRVTKGRDTWRWIAIGCFLIIGGAVFSKIKGFV